MSTVSGGFALIFAINLHRVSICDDRSAATPDSLAGVRVSASCSLCGLILLVSQGIACGKAEPGAAAPRSELDAAKQPEARPAADPERTNPAEPAPPRVDLITEFHRTRVGGGGFWVLGMISNPHAHPIIDTRARVELLDAQGEIVGEAASRVPQLLGAGARVAVAVLVSDPVEHEQLSLIASGVASDTPPPASLPLKLEYEPPQRAELGGWFVLGQVTNTGDEPIEGARLEIQGLDRAGQLLGVDWLVLDPIAARATIAFDVGDLRYEESPASFALQLRRPAPQ